MVMNWKLLILPLLLSGCVASGPASLQLKEDPVKMTTQVKELYNLPAPERQAVVAVYDFPDLTGQRKDKDGIASISKASLFQISQIALNFLLKKSLRHHVNFTL